MKKQQINPLFEKRLQSIEKLIKKFDVKITSNQTLLETHIMKFNEINEELKRQKEFSVNEIKTINEKLDRILNIKVNGVIGLENALVLVYNATAGARSNIALFNSIRKWMDSHRGLKMLVSSRITLIILSIILTYITGKTINLF